MDFRELARLIHPDISDNPHSHERMVLLNAAKGNQVAVDRLAREWGFLPPEDDGRPNDFNMYNQKKVRAVVGSQVDVIFYNIALRGWVIDEVKGVEFPFTTRYTVYFPSEDNILDFEIPLYANHTTEKPPFIVENLIGQYKRRV